MQAVVDCLQRDGGLTTLRRSESGEPEGEGVEEPRASQHVAALRTLEAWSLAEIFQRRACVSASHRESCVQEMRVAFHEVMRSRELNCVSQQGLEARSRVQMGELSAARGALEAFPVAPGTMATLAKLTDPEPSDRR